MILVVDCFNEDTFAERFDLAVAGHLEGTGGSLSIRPLVCAAGPG